MDADSDSPLNPSTMVQLPSPDLVSSLLKCTMCKKFPVYLLRPFSRCEAGHLFCYACADVQKKKTQGCIKFCDDNQVCKKPIIPGETLEVVKYMLNKSVFSCPNNGCKEKVAGEKMEEHLKECDFKTSAFCEDTACSSTSKYNSFELWEHIERVHPHVMSVLSQQELILQRSKGIPVNGKLPRYIWTAVEAHNEKFVVMVEEREDCYIIIGFMLNKKSSRRRFVFSLQLLQESQNTKSSIYWKAMRFGRGARTEEQMKNLEHKSLLLNLPKLALGTPAVYPGFVAFQNREYYMVRFAITERID